MSPNPGEEGHTASGWTHAMCRACWVDSHPGQSPVHVTDDETAPCCYCGKPTSAGIYVRQNPAEVHASGV